SGPARRSHLTATRSPSTRSSASQTSPYAPRPSGARSRYLPPSRRSPPATSLDSPGMKPACCPSAGGATSRRRSSGSEEPLRRRRRASIVVAAGDLVATSRAVVRDHPGVELGRLLQGRHALGRGIRVEHDLEHDRVAAAGGAIRRIEEGILAARGE